jgi:putative spermidine/putrescine transport system permease protein
MISLRGTVLGRLSLAISSTVILLFLALPIVVIMVTSFGNDAFGSFPPHSWSGRWYTAVFEPGSRWPAAITLSVLVALITTVLSLVLGLAAASGLSRSDLPLRSAVYGLVLAPLVIPQIVIALGLFLLFEPASMLGSPIAIALGHTVLTVPIAVMILVATLHGIDDRLEDAAASMGAGRVVIVRRIILPLAAPGAMAAGIFSFITSFDEFFVAEFLSSANTQTLPVQIFNALEFDVDPTVTAISALVILLAIFALVLVAIGRKLGGAKADQLLTIRETP